MGRTAVRRSEVLDLLEPEPFARLRARATGGMLVAGALVALFGAASDPGSPLTLGGPPLVVLVVAFVLAGPVTLLVGGRLGDRAFVVLIVAAIAGILGICLLIDASVRGLPAEMLLIGPLGLAAVFSRERRVVALVSGCACLVAAVLGISAGTELVASRVAISLAALLSIVALVRVLREAAVAALDEARVRSVTDHLTGLYNRHGVEQVGGRLWARERDAGRCLAVALVDLDRFKAVNDTFGHAAGDRLLTHVARRLAEPTGPAGVLARWGGEEFLLVVPVPRGTGVTFAEAVRLAVRDTWDTPVTVSIGVHEVCPAPEDELPEALWRAVEQADRALYAAKRAGRDRVASSHPPPLP